MKVSLMLDPVFIKKYATSTGQIYICRNTITQMSWIFKSHFLDRFSKRLNLKMSRFDLIDYFIRNFTYKKTKIKNTVEGILLENDLGTCFGDGFSIFIADNTIKNCFIGGRQIDIYMYKNKAEGSQSQIILRTFFTPKMMENKRLIGLRASHETPDDVYMKMNNTLIYTRPAQGLFFHSKHSWIGKEPEDSEWIKISQ
jgi:hypothetical protein